MDRPRYRIPFNRPSFVGNERRYVEEALRHGHLSGAGPFTARCERLLESSLGVPRVLLTTSCTHALEMTAFLLELGPGDEVILPSFTFVSTANAFALRGCRLRFADVEPTTLNLDPLHVEKLRTPRTRAIVPVHYAGVGCDMAALGNIAQAHTLSLVEDNAHGLFGTFRGRQLGTFGRLATLSFHETKNFTCGEGGAIVINDRGLAGRAEVLREKGTDRARFFRGEIDRYTWVDFGSSWVPSEILAAVLLAQLEARDLILARRRAVWERYRDRLGEWAHERGIGLPIVPEDRGQAYHMFFLVLPSGEARSRLALHLKEAGILAVHHYVPLHDSPMGRRVGGIVDSCPVASRVSECLLRLPYFTSMTADEQAIVIERIQEWTP